MSSIGIVFPTFNRKDKVKNLLHQIYEQETKLKQTTISIIAVVDGSTDGTVEMLRSEFPKVHIVEGNGSWWYTKSMNKGFDKAYDLDLDYVLTLNDDIVLDADYFMQLESILIQSKIDVVGSISLTMHQPPKVFFGGVRQLIKWRLKFVNYLKKFEAISSETLTGMKPSLLLPGRGMLIAKDVLKQLNGFDAHFPQYHSDGDFCLRAIPKGYSVFVSYDLKIYCYIDQTAKASSFMKSSFTSFLKSFFNPYSRIYIPQLARFTYRHGIKYLWPFTFSILILSHFKAFFFNKKVA